MVSAVARSPSEDGRPSDPTAEPGSEIVGNDFRRGMSSVGAHDRSRVSRPGLVLRWRISPRLVLTRSMIGCIACRAAASRPGLACSTLLHLRAVFVPDDIHVLVELFGEGQTARRRAHRRPDRDDGCPSSPRVSASAFSKAVEGSLAEDGGARVGRDRRLGHPPVDGPGRD